MTLRARASGAAKASEPITAARLRRPHAGGLSDDHRAKEGDRVGQVARRQLLRVRRGRFSGGRHLFVFTGPESGYLDAVIDFFAAPAASSPSRP
jgi:hypothetical protein